MRSVRDRVERDLLRETVRECQRSIATSQPQRQAQLVLRRKMRRRRGARRSSRVAKRNTASTIRRARAPANCPYADYKEQRGRSPAVRNSARAATFQGNKSDKSKVPCSFFQEGKRTRGDRCKFSHASCSGNSAAAASSKTNSTKKRASSPKPKPKANAAAVCVLAKPISPVGVSFQNEARVHETPAEGDSLKLEYEDREYGMMHPNAKDCPTIRIE